MSLPFTSLNAATAAGPGVVNDLETVSNEHTMIAGCTGSTPGPFGASIALEGSHDGVTVRYVRANLTGIFGGTAPTVTATIASKITEDD